MDYQNRFRETLNRKAEFGSSDAPEDKDSDLAEVEQDLAEFKNCVDSIGTPLNTERNRSEVRRLRSVIKRKLGDANTKVQKKGKGIEAQQLSKQLNNYAQRFEGLLNQEKELTRQHQARSDSVLSHTTDGSDAPMIRHQEQAMVSSLQQRENDVVELAELERDILDLHAIQKDLGGMVYEQGEITEHIETNVSNAAGRVSEGNKKLKSAAILKSKNRKLCVAITLAVAIPIVIIILVIIIVLAVVLPKN